MVVEVKDLSPAQKRAAETLLGHPVLENEAISIRSFIPPAITPAKLGFEERKAALRALSERLTLGRDLEFSADEEESAANEALRSSRPNFRPVG